MKQHRIIFKNGYVVLTVKHAALLSWSSVNPL